MREVIEESIEKGLIAFSPSETVVTLWALEGRRAQPLGVTGEAWWASQGLLHPRERTNGSSWAGSTSCRPGLILECADRTSPWRLLK